MYGQALGDRGLQDLGRLMLATELRSGFLYWQIDEHSDVYAEPFAKNGLAAVVWSTKVLDHPHAQTGAPRAPPPLVP